MRRGRYLYLVEVVGVGLIYDLIRLFCQVSLTRLLDESPWLQFTGECQRF